MSYVGEGGSSVNKLIKFVVSMIAVLVMMGLYMLMGYGNANAATKSKK